MGVKDELIGEMYWPKLERKSGEDFDPNIIFKHYVKCGGQLTKVVGMPDCPTGYPTVKKYASEHNFKQHYEMYKNSVEKIYESYREGNNPVIEKMEKILEDVFDELIPEVTVDPDTGEKVKNWKLRPTSFEKAGSLALLLAKEIREQKAGQKDYSELEKIIQLNLREVIRIVAVILNNFEKERVISQGVMYQIIKEITDAVNARPIILKMTED